MFQNSRMILFEKALECINLNLPKRKFVSCKITEIIDGILAEDIYAPISLPPFRQSAMDGYAFKYSGNKTLKVIGEVRAGEFFNPSLNNNEAVRIFTGARVPDEANTVVIQEHVERNLNEITIAKIPEKGDNVRDVGEQIKKGDLALKKGNVLNSASIGYLANFGIENVPIYRAPKVSVIGTGDELVALGNQLEEGKIYDSNTLMLQSVLKKNGVETVSVTKAVDTLEDVTREINKALEISDLILISGGISVGDYDFVRQALIDIGVEELFYKVNQRPGKPLWFGKKEDKLVVALPGNPASSLSCFLVYVLPIIRHLRGLEFNHNIQNAKFEGSFQNKTGKQLFLKAEQKDGKISLLSHQASSMLHSFALSNALLLVSPSITELKSGDIVPYINIANDL